MDASAVTRMLGDAITTPIRVAALMQESVAAFDEVTRDAVRDAAALAIAATERSAATSARAAKTVTATADKPEKADKTERSRKPGTAGTPSGTIVSVDLPDPGQAAAADVAEQGGSPVTPDARIHVRTDARTTTYATSAILAHKHRRVDYDFFSGIAPEIRHPGGALPGANRWDVPPSAERPVPVILVHGTAGGGQTNWGPYVPLLTGRGFSVFTLTYGAIPGSKWPVSAMGGMRLIEDSAAEFGAFVERVLAATGAERVDVVGHSQGTIVPDYWAKFLGGTGTIRRYVSLAPLWQGTSAFGVLRGSLGALGMRFGSVGTEVAASLSIPQMIAGSEFIDTLGSDGGPYLPGIEYTNISTRHDEFVVPYTSGQLPGGPGTDVTNIVVQDGCPEDHSDHLGICGSKRAATIVLNALDDIDQTPVPRGYVPPLFG